MSEIEKAAAHNMAHFMERGPALSFAYKSYVLARRPATGEVLVGGLGSMGVGQMWMAEREHHHRYPGYDEAPIVGDGAVAPSTGDDVVLGALAESAMLHLREAAKAE